MAHRRWADFGHQAECVATDKVILTWVRYHMDLGLLNVSGDLTPNSGWAIAEPAWIGEMLYPL